MVVTELFLLLYLINLLLYIFLSEAVVNRSGFNALSTNSSDAHVYERVFTKR